MKFHPVASDCQKAPKKHRFLGAFFGIMKV